MFSYLLIDSIQRRLEDSVKGQNWPRCWGCSGPQPRCGPSAWEEGRFALDLAPYVRHWQGLSGPVRDMAHTLELVVCRQHQRGRKSRRSEGNSPSRV